MRVVFSIKPENLLLSADGKLKIGDFGLSVHTHESNRLTMAGTLDYLAPEIIARAGHGKQAGASGVSVFIYFSSMNQVDVWATGVLAYELVVGKPPFETETKLGTKRRILKAPLTFPDHVTPSARDLIKKLMRKNPIRRLKLKLVAKHAWILQHTNADIN